MIELDRKECLALLASVPVAIVGAFVALLVFGLIVLTKPSSLAPNEPNEGQTGSTGLHADRGNSGTDLSGKAK